MKIVYIILIVLTMSLAIDAQEYAMVSNGYLETAKQSNQRRDSNFTSNVRENDQLRYRDFLKTAKTSDETFKIGEQVFTKKILTKLIRKGARRSENAIEFELFLYRKNKLLTTYFSKNEMAFLFQKFRDRTLHNYIDNLAINLDN